MSGEMVCIFLAITLVWAIAGPSYSAKVDVDAVAPREEGEEDTAAVAKQKAEKKISGPPNQVNHHSKKRPEPEGNLAVDTFTRMKEKSNVKFE